MSARFPYGHPLKQLFLLRVLQLVREPSLLVWSLLLPIFIAVVLGYAFKTQDAHIVIAVADGPGADAIADSADALDDVTTLRANLADAEQRLKRNQVSLIVIPGAPPELVFDPGQVNGRLARTILLGQLERRAEGTISPIERHHTALGTRYIDFLLPGLIAVTVMNTVLTGFLMPIVRMRLGRILKLFLVTPMRRWHFFTALILERAFALPLLLAAVLSLIAHHGFGSPIEGSIGALLLTVIAGGACFAGIGLLLSVRTTEPEEASGLVSLTTMAMLGLSTVFIPATSFSPWLKPLLKVLPLPVLAEAVRSIMNEGAGLTSLAGALFTLVTWGAVTLALGMRWFRWS